MTRAMLVWALLGLLACVCLARAGEPDDQLVIAQAAVAECGWSGAENDCPAAVWHRLRQQQTDRGTVWRPLWRVTMDYCRAWRRKDWPRKWVRQLRPDHEAPEGWPASASWERHRRAWERIHAKAGRFLAGKVPDPCQSYALDFGNAGDTQRDDGASWVAVHCGDTGGQHFGYWQKGDVH